MQEGIGQSTDKADCRVIYLQWDTAAHRTFIPERPVIVYLFSPLRQRTQSAASCQLQFIILSHAKFFRDIR